MWFQYSTQQASSIARTVKVPKLLVISYDSLPVGRLRVRPEDLTPFEDGDVQQVPVDEPPKFNAGALSMHVSARFR